MEILFSILLMIIVVLIISIGLSRTIQILPALIIFGLLFWFFGWVIINFFWVFVIIWLIRKLTLPKSTQRKTYYKTYTAKEAEEFFRQFYGQGRYHETGYQNYGGYNNNQSYNTNTWTINKDEYYKELGVEKSCTKEELRKAYLKKVKENHPDRFTNASEQDKKYHEEKLKKINEAYDNLIKDFS